MLVVARPLAASLAALASVALLAACSAGSNTGGRSSGAGGAYAGSDGGGPSFGGVVGIGGDSTFPLGSGGNGTAGGAAAGGAGNVSVETPESVDACATNSGGLDPAVLAAIQAGGGGAGTMRLLNPYEGTVFPRGLIAPLLMWDGAAGDAVYVHLRASTFEYKGCLKPTGAGQLQIPQEIWNKASDHAHGASDPYTLELTVSSGGVVVGPVTHQIVIAQATLKGTIYYNSYASKLAGALFGSSSGAVLRITPGKTAEALLGFGECIGCHSVSANGSRLVANPVLDLSGGATFALTPGMAPNPKRLVPTAAGTAFPAISPDGSVYLSGAHRDDFGTRNGIAAIFQSQDATLYETDTGVVVPNTGVPGGAMTPMFSPDGTLLVFNDYAIDGSHGLAVMNYDRASRKATGYRKVYGEAKADRYPAWPFFLPDNGTVLFTAGTAKDFSGANLGINGETGVVSSDVYWLDLASGQSHILAKAMGYDAEGDENADKTYLPFGAEELHHNFYPTGSPVAAGGYFWVFFDSYRRYGNAHGGKLVRQLWGTAVDIAEHGAFTVDPSHPPFYLTGQEDAEGNHRAFTALDPCRADGDTCATGIDCCVGYCTDNKCGKPPPTMEPTCAKTDESCADGTPCCNERDRCIAGFCGQIAR